MDGRKDGADYTFQEFSNEYKRWSTVIKREVFVLYNAVDKNFQTLFSDTLEVLTFILNKVFVKMMCME